MNSKQQIIYESRNADMGLGEVLRFNIPPSVMLINNAETFLKFNVRVGAKGFVTLANATTEADTEHWYPWTMGLGGAYNLIKNLVIKTQDGVVLETITDYNSFHRVLSNYVKNSTEKNLDRLYAGADTEYVKRVNTLTRRKVDGAGASEALQTQENMEIEVCLPLKLSGIFSNPQPYPNFLAPLQVEIQLEDDAFKVVHAQGFQLGADAPNFQTDKENQNRVAGWSGDTITYRVDGTPNTNNITSLEILKTSAGGNDNVYTGDIGATQTANHPFWVGQSVRVKADADVDLVISGIQESGAGDKLQINFDSTNAFNGQATANPQIFVKDTGDKPSLTLSKIQMIVGSIQPSPQQLQAMESAVKSGYAYNYKSYYDFPVNISSGVLSASNLINCKFKRCKSILSFCEDIQTATAVYWDNLAPFIKPNYDPKDYQYKLGGLLVPNRRVDVSRYIRNRTQQGGWNAVHIKELEQALACAGYQCKDLSNIDGAFMFGRGLVTKNSGFTYDMSGNEEARLNINFNANGQNLLNHNYVCHLKTLVIKDSMKMVEE